MVTPNIALRGTNNMTFWTDQISCFSKNVKFLMVRKIDRFPTQGKPLRTNAPALWGLTKWQMPGGMVTLGVTRAISVNFMDLKHKLISGKYYRGAKRSKLLFTVSRGFPKQYNWKVLFCFREKITNWSRTLPEYGVDKMESGNSKHDNALVWSASPMGAPWAICGGIVVFMGTLQQILTTMVGDLCPNSQGKFGDLPTCTQTPLKMINEICTYHGNLEEFWC